MKHITRWGLLFLLVLSATLPMTAQKKSEKAQNTEKAVVEKTEAEKMMDQYNFEAAIERLEEEIEKAKKQKKPFGQQDSLQQLAQRGNTLLSGTERVVFIDSLVVGKDSILPQIFLNKESGTIINASELKTFAGLMIGMPGQTAYLNELKDEILYSDTLKGETKRKLATSICIGDEWTAAMPLPGISQRDEEQDYPFMLTDGVTMYYAAKGEESFGGYDIFVTRYNPDSKTFFKPENIGMPFNSPANDYLYFIDERYNIGWFVSDRNQPKGKVCIYTFIPNNTRKTYDIVALGKETVQRAARIHSIAESQWSTTDVEKAQQRIEQLKKDRNALKITRSERYIINDKVVYTSLSEFRSERARDFAAQCEKMRRTITQRQQQLDELRKRFAAASPRPAELIEGIKNLEQAILQEQETICFMEKNMRREELNVLQDN